METTLKKSGDSVYVVIPEAILVKAGIKIGDPVNVTVDHGKVLVEGRSQHGSIGKFADP